MIRKLRYEVGDKEAWLALRTSLEGRLGGSEVGAAANHSKYSSFLKMLEEYVGLREREDISGKMAVKLGVFNEEFVAQEFESRSGKKVHRENCIFLNDDFPHLKASIDRKIANEDSGLECKFMSDLTMMHFKRGDFPEPYKDQCVTYLAVTGLRRWYLAIVTNSAFYGFLMTRDKAAEDRYYALKAKCQYPDENTTEEELAEWKRDWAWLDAVYYLDDAEMAGAEIVAAHFLDCVAKVKGYMAEWEAANPDKDVPSYAQSRAAALTNAVYQVVEPSDIDGGEPTEDALDALSPVAVPDSVIEVAADTADGQELVSLLAERARLNAEKKEHEDRIAEIDNLLALRMKEAETMLLPDWKVTHKNAEPRRSCSADNVEGYFDSKGIALPDGLIKASEGKRSLRVYSRSAKPRKGKAA